MSKKSDLLQEQRIQHELVAGHNAWINKKIQENISEKNDENEWNRKKKKKKLTKKKKKSIKKKKKKKKKKNCQQSHKPG